MSQWVVDLFACSSESESDTFSEHPSDNDFIVSDNERTGDLSEDEQLEIDRTMYVRSLKKPRGPIRVDESDLDSEIRGSSNFSFLQTHSQIDNVRKYFAYA